MKKSFISRLFACALIALMVLSTLAVSALADNTTASYVTSLSTGDKVVIYYPDAAMALGNSLSKNKIAAVDAVVNDGKLTVTADMGICVVEKDTVTNAYYLAIDGKYLTSGQTGNSMSLADEKTDLGLWVLEKTDNGFYVKNYAAVYVAGETSKPQYLEYFSGFTTYSFNASKANIYTFQFYKIDDAPVAPPVDEPEEVTFSTIADARKGENNAIFNVKGVVTFIDGKNVVVEDETGAINLYLKAAAEVEIGNKITATGKRGAFNGLQQLTSAEVLEIIEENATVPAPEATTLAEVLADAEVEELECRFVSLKGLTLGETDAEKSTTVLTDDEGNTINIYRCPELSIAVGTKVNVVALVSDYKGYQLRVIDASAITEFTDEPTDEPSDEPSEDPSAPAKPGDTSAIAFYAVIALISFVALVSFTRKTA